MGTYYAQPICDGWVEVEVEADNVEEARKKMVKILEEMDFGCLRDVSWNLNEALECEEEEA